MYKRQVEGLRTIDGRCQRIGGGPLLYLCRLVVHLLPVKGVAQVVLRFERRRDVYKRQALLEAMQERQVTIGDDTYKLPEPFLVLATQNPLEQEGTYPLPEAQVDRFMLKAKISYPTKQEERDIVRMRCV